MVAGDQHDRRLGQRLAKPLELAEGEDDGGVGRANGVKQIPGHHHDLGARGDNAVHGRPERLGDVRFALVDAGGGLAMILPRPEVRVGDMGELHGVENAGAGPPWQVADCRLDQPTGSGGRRHLADSPTRL